MGSVFFRFLQFSLLASPQKQGMPNQFCPLLCLSDRELERTSQTTTLCAVKQTKIDKKVITANAGNQMSQSCIQFIFASVAQSRQTSISDLEMCGKYAAAYCASSIVLLCIVVCQCRLGTLTFLFHLLFCSLFCRIYGLRNRSSVFSQQVRFRICCW